MMLSFMCGVVLVVVLVILYNVVVYSFSNQKKLSCHHPKAEITHTEYCVYHSTTPGLFGDRYNLLIGPSPGRGVSYDIPYSVGEIKVDWDKGTEVVTINMSGSILTIPPTVYIDTR